MHILVVEDDKKIAIAIKRGLEIVGYAVDVESDGEAGYYAASSEAYDVIITDIMMPKLDGFGLIKKLREDQITTPIIALTARTQERDVISGLDSGADDYVTKPFSYTVLLARVRALLRRPPATEQAVLRIDDVELDVASHVVSRDGASIQLSIREFALLEYLVRNKNRVVSKETIISHVWDFDADILPNTVEVFINSLRKKLEKSFPKRRKLIQTIRGLGYTIKDAG